MFEFLLIQKLMYLLLGGLGVYGGFTIYKNGSKTLATSKLGKKKEYEKLTGEDGFKLSKHMQLNFKKSCENVVVIAPPGEGKTRSFFKPNLLSNHFPKSSIVIPDPKGKLYEDTAAYQRSIGRKVFRLQVLGKEGHYNPLSHCSNFTEVRQLAVNILENAQLASGNSESKSSEWVSMSAPLLTAALLYEDTIPKALDLIIMNDEEMLEKIFKQGSTQALKQFMIFKTSMRSPGTVDSIRSTLATSLAIYSDTLLINTISKNDFTPEQLRKEPIAIYIQYETSKAKYLSPFLGIFYTQLIDKVMNAYFEGCLPVIFLMEELQNIGKIQGLENILAISREYEMPFMCCLQNTVKLNDIYGPNNAMTILNCLKTKCILPSLSDMEALKYISDLCGETEIEIPLDKEKVNRTSRKLFTPDEVRRLSNDNKNSDNKVLIVAHNKLPYLDNQIIL